MKLFVCVALNVIAAAHSKALNVLVFGDSQGDVGPTYQELNKVFAAHGVNATVENAAVGGTLACGWFNDDNDAITTASRSAFHLEAPDLVWFTAGGNDMAEDKKAHACYKLASDLNDAKACMDAAVGRMIGCTTGLFDNLWTTFPYVKIGQYNYMATQMDEDCGGENCLESSAQFIGGSYCLDTHAGGPTECMLTLLEYFQTIYVDAIQAMYPAPQYTGMNILGSTQMANDVPGASISELNVTGAGAKCEMMISCVHPMYGTSAADIMGQGWWDQWLSAVTSENET